MIYGANIPAVFPSLPFDHGGGKIDRWCPIEYPSIPSWRGKGEAIFTGWGVCFVYARALKEIDQRSIR